MQASYHGMTKPNCSATDRVFIAIFTVSCNYLITAASGRSRVCFNCQVLGSFEGSTIACLFAKIKTAVVKGAAKVLKQLRSSSIHPQSCHYTGTCYILWSPTDRTSVKRLHSFKRLRSAWFAIYLFKLYYKIKLLQFY